VVDVALGDFGSCHEWSVVGQRLAASSRDYVQVLMGIVGRRVTMWRYSWLTQVDRYVCMRRRVNRRRLRQ
jgi:hypothetical protein